MWCITLICLRVCLRVYVCDVPLNSWEYVFATLNSDKVGMCGINADKSSENLIAMGSLRFSFSVGRKWFNTSSAWNALPRATFRPSSGNCRGLNT